MWLPFLLEQQIFSEMQKAGCKLSSEEIYSANKACLSNAIVMVGGGCSGGILSKDGLLITNHHCVKSQIQNNSSISNNYLQNGFFAKSKSEELLAKGLTVSVFHSMQDVTDSILVNVLDTLTIAERNLAIKKNTKFLKHLLDSLQPDLTHSVESFYSGNQYILFSYKKYKDIRLVAFMPSDVAGFGGASDNWAWPRHSADFALLRIYADSLNNPAAYAESNKTYSPLKHIEIDTSGVKEGDFTMTMGFPAVTNSYSTSFELEDIYTKFNPMKLGVYSLRLNPMTAHMQTGKEANLQYYAKQNSLDNYYIKWQGEQDGIKKANAIAKKQNQEKAIAEWIKKDKNREQLYANVLEDYNAAYENHQTYFAPLYAYSDGIWRMDFWKLFDALVYFYNAKTPEQETVALDKIYSVAQSYFDNCEMSIEKQSFPDVFTFISKTFGDDALHTSYKELNEDERARQLQSVVNKSLLFNEDVYLKCKQKTLKKGYKKSKEKIVKMLNKDLGVAFMKENQKHVFMAFYMKYQNASNKLDSAKREYLAMLMDFNNEKAIFPEANSTQRVSYGNVSSYIGFNNAKYPFATTQEGMIKKWNSSNKDYVKDAKLDSIFSQKQFGSFFNDTLYLNFIATNQTSGGSSGSPVFNAEGNLIGINFDRNKEGTLSDYYYEPAFCRNIIVDIRYVLFCIEVYGNASSIINELTFVKK